MVPVVLVETTGICADQFRQDSSRPCVPSNLDVVHKQSQTDLHFAQQEC